MIVQEANSAGHRIQWQGYPLLRNYFQFLSLEALNVVTLTDFVPGRSLQGQIRNYPNYHYNTTIHGDPCESFTYAPHLIETTMSSGFEDMWHNGVNNVRNLRRSKLRYAYPYKTFVPTNISAVRARCNIMSIGDFNATHIFAFPGLPEYEYFKWRFWTWNSTVDAAINGTETLSRWIPVSQLSALPDDPDQTPPSATVLISLAPYSRIYNFSQLYILPCSVDARWASVTNIRVSTLQQREPHNAEPLHTVERGGCGNPFPPSPNGTWKHISFDQDFLKWLAPSLDGGPSSSDTFKLTTLAEIINNTAQTSTQSTYDDKSDFSARAAKMLLAHFFAEALSRIGLSDNIDLWANAGPLDQLDRRYVGALLRSETAVRDPPFENSVETSWQMQNTGQSPHCIRPSID